MPYLSLAGKELTSYLSCVMFSGVFVTFPCGALSQVWYLIDQFLIFASSLLCCLKCVANALPGNKKSTCPLVITSEF